MKPAKGSYPLFYETYISKTPENDVTDALNNSYKELMNCISAIPSEKENHAYAPGKWTVKQLMNHLTDTERIFAYRALRFARKDPQLLAPFEENDYAEAADVSKRSLKDLLQEFEYARLANIAMFRSFS